MALVTVLLTGVLLLAFGMAATFMAGAETAIAAADRSGREALYAAEGAAEAARAELAGVPSWDAVLGGQLSVFHDTGLMAHLPDGPLAVDLAKRTAVLQAAADRTGVGVDTPRWRLFAWGPASMLLPAPVAVGPYYLAVWVADDPADGDGDPLTDANGIVTVHAEAYGPSGVRRAVECVVSRGSETGSRPIVLSWRELRPI